uniref:uncharacterized protein LOC122607946 n=1 Tax=Erigeron canadensis TaxID=72917 RepID=UPI001CB88E55|nr:uncharacterized protein LOC122607946 [Erigeron canadensis]
MCLQSDPFTSACHLYQFQVTRKKMTTPPNNRMCNACSGQDHIRLLVQSYAIIAHDRSKEDMVIELEAMISGSLDLVNDLDVADSVRNFMIDICHCYISPKVDQRRARL